VVPETQALVLIRTVIRSVWALEILLLMRGQPDRVWPIAALVGELRANTALVEQNLRSLVAGGLVTEDATGFRYHPATPLLKRACDILEQQYRERPVALINLIVGAATDTVQGFADAFRFKRRDD
jgi:DNA-binding IclR family transcriptional regulator